jgi:DNA-binding GntR family transcriptional regulator
MATSPHTSVIVTVQGAGTFVIPAEKMQDLLIWLTANSAKLHNTHESNSFKGKTIING